MKAIFLEDVGGRFVELERRVTAPVMDYYRVKYSPVDVQFVEKLPPDSHNIEVEREHWICIAKPAYPEAFAFFIRKPGDDER